MENRNLPEPPPLPRKAGVLCLLDLRIGMLCGIFCPPWLSALGDETVTPLLTTQDSTFSFIWLQWLPSMTSLFEVPPNSEKWWSSGNSIFWDEHWGANDERQGGKVSQSLTRGLEKARVWPPTHLSLNPDPALRRINELCCEQMFLLPNEINNTRCYFLRMNKSLFMQILIVAGSQLIF